jgi:hypothetical protein
MKSLFVLITIFFVGCATHAPMSEMVMFNIERDCATDSLAKYTNFGIGLQYSNNGPFEEEYDKKNEQDYLGVEDSYSEGVALSIYVLDEDRFGFGYAIGLANGLDITAKINGDYYGTVSLSSTASFTTIFQRRFVVNESKGVSAGIYLSRGAQSYYSKCRDCFQIAPDEYTSLYHAGLRSVLLFRNPYKGGSGFTGSVNAGYIFEINEPYLGFSVAFLTF